MELSTCCARLVYLIHTVQGVDCICTLCKQRAETFIMLIIGDKNKEYCNDKNYRE